MKRADHRKVAITVVALSLMIAIGSVEAKTVNVADFGAKPDGNDVVGAVRAAIAECQRVKAKRLIFPKGRYLFRDNLASEKYFFISNNDEGLKRIAFLLENVEGLEIDGQDSDFVFDGYVNPFILDHSKKITLKNFTIDYVRTFHSEGKIIADPEEGLDVEIPEQFPYEIRNDILVFTDGRRPPRQPDHTTPRRAEYPYGGLLEFDPVKKETAFMAGDCGKPELVVKRLGGRKLRLMMQKLTGTPGNVMVFGPNHRKVPGFVISDSSDTRIEGVTLYHCGGMGVIGQRSHNITLKRVIITQAPKSGRVLSITADATHYVNCTGKIEMAHCRFNTHLDDPSNIHGIYAKIVEMPSENEILVQFVHRQQFGFDFIQAGDKLEVVERESLITLGEATVKSVARMNKEFTRVVLTSPLPKGAEVGDAVAELRDYPEVHIHHCRMSGNRARGFLLNSRGKTLIEDNYFHIAGTSLLFEGDARFWFEQAGARNCVIRNNMFDNCNYGVWGRATIEVRAGIEEEHRARSRYNRNILIEGNTFKAFDNYSQVKMYSVDGVTIRDNRIEYTDAYPKRGLNAQPFDIVDCDNVVIKDNEFARPKR